jgi:hypothetical protein
MLMEGLRVKGGGLELKYGHCSLHCEMLMEGMEGPFFYRVTSLFFPRDIVCGCLQTGIIFFFLVKRGSKWTLLDQWSSWGIIVSTTLCIIKLNREDKF